MKQKFAPQPQKYILIQASELLDRVEQMKNGGYRLVQICCTRVPEGFELTYSFALDTTYEFCHLRLTVPVTGWVMSITSLYWPAFIYENEMHDLFGIDIRHIAHDVDYKGTFYRLAEKTPWHDLPKKPAVPVRPPVKKPPVAEKPQTAPAEGEKRNG